MNDVFPSINNCSTRESELATLACSHRGHLVGKGSSSYRLFENWITKKELADHLSVSEAFITKLMYEEGLPHLKIGRAVRFSLADVYSWFHKKGMKL